jgi:cytosine/adenosine deaminase-related metal-dependent hydrolase
VTARKTWSISAAWILPADGRTLTRGVLRGRGATIEAVGPEPLVAPSDSGQHRDLGQAVILPGLVNAHTHLELTGLRGHLPRHKPITQWLDALRSHWPAAAELGTAVVQGAEEALAAGTTALADICHNHRAWRKLKDTPLRCACFAEVQGMGPLADDALARLQKYTADCRATVRMRFGISPNAPYTTSVEVYRQAVRIARKHNWLLCTHLAETESERQFLLHGTGRLMDFLLHTGLPKPALTPPGCTPVGFARDVGLFDGPCILAHVNFLDDAEMKILASSGASVVCCPRSNDFFGRSGHRYAEMLAAGINVAVGTDSLASNTSLDVIAELARLRSEAKVDNQTLLRMGTLNGAKALGWDDRIGSLEPGKQADWVALSLPPGTTAPLEAVFTGQARVMEVGVAGKVVWRAKAEAAEEGRKDAETRGRGDAEKQKERENEGRE